MQCPDGKLGSTAWNVAALSSQREFFRLLLGESKTGSVLCMKLQLQVKRRREFFIP